MVYAELNGDDQNTVNNDRVNGVALMRRILVDSKAKRDKVTVDCT